MRLTVTPQLYYVLFQVEGAAGASWEVAVDESWRRSGSGDSTFNQAFEPGGHTAVLRVSGAVVQTVVFSVQPIIYTPPEPPTLPPPPPPPPVPIPPPPNVTVWGTTGTRCDRIKWSSGMAEWFTWRNRYTGAQGEPVTDHTVATRMAEAQAQCFEPLPGSAEGWFGDIQKLISGMFGSVTSAISGVTDRLQALEDFLKDFWQKLEDWLVERLVGLMLRALDQEVEKRGG